LYLPNELVAYLVPLLILQEKSELVDRKFLRED
jgi:hypothetical protein